MRDSVRTILESMDCLTLTANGGCYWLLEDRLMEFERVADVFEMASNDETAIDILTVTLNERTLRAVGRKLTEEVTQEVEEIEGELATGELKERACEARLHRTYDLLCKVQRYENVCGIQMQALHDALERAATAAALATLQASAATVPQDKPPALTLVA